MMKIFEFSRNHQKAQGTLEFALVLPIFMALLLGIFEIALMFFYNVTVANASREAARYAASSGCPGSTCTATDMHYYQDCQGIKNRAISKAPGIGLKKTEITIKYDGGPDNNGAISVVTGECIDPSAIPTPNPTLKSGDRIVVTVTKQFTLIIPIPGLKSFPIVSKTYRTYLGTIQ